MKSELGLDPNTKLIYKSGKKSSYKPTTSKKQRKRKRSKKTKSKKSKPSPLKLIITKTDETIFEEPDEILSPNTMIKQRYNQNEELMKAPIVAGKSSLAIQTSPLFSKAKKRKKRPQTAKNFERKVIVKGKKDNLTKQESWEVVTEVVT